MGKIIWLASYPKSGNTWLRAFLHNLLRNPNEPYDINKLADFTKSDAAMLWYSMIDKRKGSEITKEEIAALRPTIHRFIAQSRPDSHFVKTHNRLTADRGTPLISMEQTGGAIYVVRNPLDVTPSYAHHMGITLDLAIKRMAMPGFQSENSDQYCYQVYGSWSQHVQSWTAKAHPGLHVVRYEDMLEAPLKAFGGVVKFLGLNVAPERLSRTIEQSSFNALRAQEERQGFVEKSAVAERFFREGKAGEGINALTHEQVDAVVTAHREQMARFGYWPLPRR